MKRFLFKLFTYGATLVIGFALGIYMLPILQAPPAPDNQAIMEEAKQALYQTTFTKALKGSDFLHWGEGELSLTADKIVYNGKLSPGPDYRLYLVNEFVEEEAAFLAIKDSAHYVGDVKTFDGFILELSPDIQLEDYNTAIIWCEAFSEFITAAQYR